MGKQITIDEADKFAKTMDPKYRALASEIQKNISAGMTAGAAVDAAVISTGFTASFTDTVMATTISSAERALRGEVTKVAAYRKWWLNKHWTGQELTLAETIADMSKMTDIKNTLRSGMKAQKTWVQLSKGLVDKQLIKADVAKHISELERAARRVIGGDAAAMTEYRKALRVSKAQIETLATGGAPSQRLKKAYANVVKQAEKLSIVGLEKGMDRAMTAKLRSNGDRIARTEVARGYIEGTYERAVNDDDVIGMRYHLSSRHPMQDICDFHTGANLYNLGQGGYPLADLPPYPFHPNCLCVETNIYSGEIKPLNTQKAQDYLNRQSGIGKKRLLGAQGAKNFTKNPKAWRQDLKMYKKPQPIEKLMGNPPF